MGNKFLNDARKNRADEFYTSYTDIADEMKFYLDHDSDVFRGKTILCPCDNPLESNFTKYFLDHFAEYGIKRLISTCWSGYAEGAGFDKRTTLLDLYEATFHTEEELRGRILDTDKGREVSYLEGNGDFRSEEVTKLRDKADMIITNPPFSLFRQFFDWIFASKAQYSVLGNILAYKYVNIFPEIKSGKMLIGKSIRGQDDMGGAREFRVPMNYPLEAVGTRVDANGTRYIRVKGVRWFTDIPFDTSMPRLSLNTMKENEGGKHKELNGGYDMYDNLFAIEVPYTDAIPSDYKGIMGVPITFLDKWNSDQFELIGTSRQLAEDMEFEDGTVKRNPGMLYIDEKPVYDRIIIRSR